ncbi:metallophosphoesterase family protein [soil metagenome]
MKVGLIADTHGLLRTEVWEHFAEVEHILHAGDIGPLSILTELRTIAPVTAVWGNTDDWDIRDRVPEVVHTEIAGVQIVVLHGHQLGSPTAAKAAAAFPDSGLVLFGHSHLPGIKRVGSVLAVNPGSAGPPRFGGPVTLAVADLQDGAVDARLITLHPQRRT